MVSKLAEKAAEMLKREGHGTQLGWDIVWEVVVCNRPKRQLHLKTSKNPMIMKAV